MTFGDVVVTVAFLLALFSIVILAQWAMREIGWYRARLEQKAVGRNRDEQLAIDAAFAQRQRDAELREWHKEW